MSITDEHPLATRTRDELATAIDIINIHLGGQARERGWCSAYEYFIEDVNAAVGFAVLSPCKRVVTATVTYTVPRYWEGHGLRQALRDAIAAHAEEYSDDLDDAVVHVMVDGEPASDPE